MNVHKLMFVELERVAPGKLSKSKHRKTQLDAKSAAMERTHLLYRCTDEGMLQSFKGILAWRQL